MDKEFVLGKLFDIENNWVYGKNKNWKTRFSKPTKSSIPVISGITLTTLTLFNSLKSGGSIRL